MSRAYFCITHRNGDTIPTLSVNGRELNLSQREFFALMSEAVWVAKVLAQDSPARDAIADYYNQNLNQV